MVVGKWFFALLQVLVLVCAFFPRVEAALAEGVLLGGSQRISFSVDDKGETPMSRLAPIALPGGSTLTLVSPNEWVPLAKRLLGQLEETHQYYSNLLGPIPSHTTTLRLVESEQFYRESGAPRWTNAMYYRGEISIPLTVGEKVDLDNLVRSIKHEYTHAVINALSTARCPGWLDEGIAQWAEGTVNPALEPALRAWILRREPVPLNLLQGGFTRLEPAMVPPAYGQSLFAAKAVLNSFGVSKLQNYFKRLRKGEPKPDAFEAAFGVSEAGFERALGSSLKKWSKTRDEHFLE